MKMKNGTIEPLHEASLPFALDSSITLSDHDYGIWYMDALEHPHKYEGKQITYQAKVYPSPKAQANAYVLGREAMVCCSEDTSLIALWVFTEQELPEAGTWLQISGTIGVAYDADYGRSMYDRKETKKRSSPTWRIMFILHKKTAFKGIKNINSGKQAIEFVLQ